MRFERLYTARPVLHCRAFRDAPCAVASGRLADNFEIPRIEPPALRPIMQGRATDSVHHRVDRQPRRIGRRSVRPMCRYLAIRFLSRLRPAAEVVAQFIRGEVARHQPSTRLNADYLKPRLRQRKGCDAANGPEADDHNVSFLQVSGHGYRLSL